jgi:hypothetical protein
MRWQETLLISMNITHQIFWERICRASRQYSLWAAWKRQIFKTICITLYIQGVNQLITVYTKTMKVKHGVKKLQNGAGCGGGGRGLQSILRITITFPFLDKLGILQTHLWLMQNIFKMKKKTLCITLGSVGLSLVTLWFMRAKIETFASTTSLPLSDPFST